MNEQTTKICPMCRERYSFQPYDIDYEHTCQSGLTIWAYEDIPLIGNYTDFSTNNAEVLVSPSQTEEAGTQDKHWGTNVRIDSPNAPRTTPNSRGANPAITRSRPRIVNFDLKKEDEKNAMQR